MEVILLVLGFIGFLMARGLQKRMSAAEHDLKQARSEIEALQMAVGASPWQTPSPSPSAPVATPSRGAASSYEDEADTEQATVSAAARAAAAVSGDATPSAAASTPQAASAMPSLEERLGTRWAVWVGGLALALGALLLVKYSIEQGVFGPGMRIFLAALLSAALIGGAEWLRRTETSLDIQGVPSAHIPSILTAAGTVAAFGTIYAAHALYDFIDATVAFVLLGITGIATMFAAALHGPALAGLGLAGALITPLLVSSNNPKLWPLVIYLAVVSAAAYWLARTRRWLWLACCVVAGAVLWTVPMLPILAHVGAADTLAAYTHGLVQLALAGLFMAIEPHLGRPDREARPDWIASAALAALGVVSAMMLFAARFDSAGWTLFVVSCVALLLFTAYRSSPAAVASCIAGVVALAAASAWPGLRAPVDRQLMWPQVGDIMRLPDNIMSYLLFASLLSLAVLAVSAFILWQRRTLPLPTAALYALGAIATPLLVLIVAYLRVTQFDHSLSFGLIAVILAALHYLIADRFDNVGTGNKTATTRLATGAFAAGVTAAMALAFTFSLDRGYLTVAFAVTAATTALFAIIDKIPLLRYVVAAIGFIVLGRLAWDPRIVGSDVGTWPIFNWLLVGYGAPAAAFLGAGYILKREREDLASRISDALGVLFAALLVFFQIRHALNGGDVLRPASGHVEMGLLATTSLGFSYVLSKLDLMRGNPIFRAASLIAGVVAAGFTLIGLGVLENPLFVSDPVGGRTIFSTLVPAYLLPGAVAAIAARAARGVRPNWYVTGLAVLALVLLFGYVTLEVRHAFQGERISFFRRTFAPEIWSYSVAWLALGLAFLAYGLMRGSLEARLASAALIVLSVVKVFLFDLSGITGLWRALSFIVLGLVLMGIGLVYQKLIFAKPAFAAGPKAAPE
jgi:uncharacterized membrane protein